MGMGVSTGMNTALERIAVSALALLAAAVIFGLLLILYAGVDPFEAYALMYQGAFGSWFSFQNTLTRAAPLILTALCTALCARHLCGKSVYRNLCIAIYASHSENRGK